MGPRRRAVRGMRFGGVMTAGRAVTVAPPIMAMAAEMEPEGPKAEGLRGSGQRIESESSKQGQTQEKRPPRKGKGKSLSGHS